MVSLSTTDKGRDYIMEAFIAIIGIFILAYICNIADDIIDWFYGPD